MARRLDWEAAKRRDQLKAPLPELETPPKLPPGHTPMSIKQRKYLKALCSRHGQSFDPTMSRKAASNRIRELKARETQSRRK